MAVSIETAKWLRPGSIAKTMDVSVDTVLKMAKEGELEAVRFRGQIRISQQSFLAYMKEHRLHSVTQEATRDETRSCESYESSDGTSEAKP